jgi:hypothetical protein
VQTLLQRAPIIGNIIEIAAATTCGASFGCAALVAVVTATGAGIQSGNLGVALRAGLIAGATALASSVVGGATGAIAQELGQDAAQLFNIGAHALVGCGSSVASGGNCGSGALAAGITSAAGPAINQLPFEAAVAASSVVGGLASVAGGGKFANGAATGAFAYLVSPASLSRQQSDDPYSALAMDDEQKLYGKPLQGFPSDYLVIGATGGELGAVGRLFYSLGRLIYDHCQSSILFDWDAALQLSLTMMHCAFCSG